MKKSLFLLSVIFITLICSISSSTDASFSFQAQIGQGIAVFLVLSAGYSIARNFMFKNDEQES